MKAQPTSYGNLFTVLPPCSTRTTTSTHPISLKPLQALLHFRISTTLPGDTFIVSIVHGKVLLKKSTFLKLRQPFVAALFLGAASDSKKTSR